MQLLAMTAKIDNGLHAPPLAVSTMIDARIVNRFPFELTKDQKTVIGEISRDMARQFHESTAAGGCIAAKQWSLSTQ